jgi:hypothetical protein
VADRRDGGMHRLTPTPALDATAPKRLVSRPLVKLRPLPAVTVVSVFVTSLPSALIAAKSETWYRSRVPEPPGRSGVVAVRRCREHPQRRAASFWRDERA